MKAIFIQGAFKNNEGFLGKIQGFFRISHKFPIFKDFSRPGRTKLPPSPPFPPPPGLPRKESVALPTMNGPFPAELKLRKNTGVVENIKHLMTGLKGNS